MGVACRNAQLGSHEEEDDLEHTGIPVLTSPIVCANLHIRLELVQALGTLRASSPRCSSYKVLMQRPPLALRWEKEPLAYLYNPGYSH